MSITTNSNYYGGKMLKFARNLFFSETITDIYEVEKAFRKFCVRSQIFEIDDISNLLQKLPGVSCGQIVICQIIQVDSFYGEISFNFKDSKNHEFSVSLSNSAALTDLEAPLIYFSDEDISYVTSLYEIIRDKRNKLKLNMIMKDYRCYRRIRIMYPRYTGTEYTEVRMTVEEMCVSCKINAISELFDSDVRQVESFLVNYEGLAISQDICEALKKEIDFSKKVSEIIIITYLEESEDMYCCKF